MVAGGAGDDPVRLRVPRGWNIALYVPGPRAGLRLRLRGVLVWRHRSDQRQAQAEQERYGDVLAAARAEVEAFINIDYRDAQQSIDAVAASATGDFQKQYDSSTKGVVEAARARSRSWTARCSGPVSSTSTATAPPCSPPPPARCPTCRPRTRRSPATSGSARPGQGRRHLEDQEPGVRQLMAELPPAASAPSVAGSRNPTGRPRRVAGQTVPARPRSSRSRSRAGRGAGRGPVVEQRGRRRRAPVDPRPRHRRAGGLDKLDHRRRLDHRRLDHRRRSTTDEGGSTTGDGRRTTLVLVVAIVVLALVGAAEIWYLNRDDTRRRPPARPVVVGDATRGEAVETGPVDGEILDQLPGLRRPGRAGDGEDDRHLRPGYQRPPTASRDEFIARKTRLQVKAVGQSVVQASAAQAEVLLFLNQVRRRWSTGSRGPTTRGTARWSPSCTDQGWLVSSIDTQ